MEVRDLAVALKAGFRDFLRAPLFGLVIGGVFAGIGAIIVLSLTIWELPWLIYPFAIGFPLVGPFAAVGLYEVSRRLAAGDDHPKCNENNCDENFHKNIIIVI